MADLSMSRFATEQVNEARNMSEQIYEHMPKWRRVLRDLAVEAGLERFVKPPDTDDDRSRSNAGSGG